MSGRTGSTSSSRTGGVEAIDLSGWQITDEAGHTYLPPDGTTLAPGARLTLYSGRGEDRGTELYWGSTGSIWNNGGDTVTIRTESGSVAVRRSYSEPEAGRLGAVV
ncbi:hypothetical protein BRC86_08950 [Halobacteriales archaeon QS_3_64_16]|nr:MAG: hypothetical protein BRC86_08950 [Halobacteriales archaeon QS_3_64_16]